MRNIVPEMTTLCSIHTISGSKISRFCLYFNSKIFSDLVDFSLITRFRHLYGLFRQKIDYTKAFSYFYKAQAKGDKHSQAMVGYMLYHGLGVDKNLASAFDHFSKGAKQKNGLSLNGLGLMHLNGDHVKKDIYKAYELFNSASGLGDSSAQFNLASLILYEWSGEIQVNHDRGLKLLNLAAHQGHIGAMYALAITHLEGHEHYHNCGLALQLMLGIVKRGNFSKIVTEAVDSYYDGEYGQSAMLFMDAGYLGHDDGVVNSAVLIDRYQVFGPDRTVRETLEGDLELAKVAGLFGFKVSKLRRLVLGELYNLVRETVILDEGIAGVKLPSEKSQKVEKSEKSENGENLKNDDSEGNNKKLNIRKLIGKAKEGQFKGNSNYLVATRILELATKYNLNFAFVRLGDYYYYGKHPNGVNMKESFAMYKRATFYNSSIDFKAQGYLSMGSMYQMGKGVKRNIKSARRAYSKVNHTQFQKISPFLNYFKIQILADFLDRLKKLGGI